MARITVEDILTVPNRFELVLLSSKRARELSAGAPLTVARDNDKNAVVSLRELAENSIDLNDLKDRLVRSMQRNVFVTDSENQVKSFSETDIDEQEEFEKRLVSEQALLSDESVYISDDAEDDIAITDQEDDIED